MNKFWYARSRVARCIMTGAHDEGPAIRMDRRKYPPCRRPTDKPVFSLRPPWAGTRKEKFAILQAPNVRQRRSRPPAPTECPSPHHRRLPLPLLRPIRTAHSENFRALRPETVTRQSGTAPWHDDCHGTNGWAHHVRHSMRPARCRSTAPNPTHFQSTTLVAPPGPANRSNSRSGPGYRLRHQAANRRKPSYSFAHAATA